MKALRVTGYGTLENNLEFQNVPVPNIGGDEVLIECVGASVNPHDTKLTRGDFKRMEKLKFPYPIGGDVSGVIVKKGMNVKNLEIGDEVFGVVRGAIAEYESVSAAYITKKPVNLSFYEAASLPIAGMTTIQALRYANIKSGDKILIHAGSGGVGSFAIQYAKAKGAYVYTTASANNCVWVKALGADVVIDYKNESYLDMLSDLDIVYDTLGGQTTFDAFKVIKQGGRVVSILPSEINKEVAKELGIPPFMQFVFSLRKSKIEELKKQKNAYYRYLFVNARKKEDLDEMKELAENGRIRPVIEKIYAFDDSKEAFKDLTKGHAKGKLVIKIK